MNAPLVLYVCCMCCWIVVCEGNLFCACGAESESVGLGVLVEDRESCGS